MRSGQAQKEIIFNEAMARIDSLIQISAEGISGAPPADPAPGETWIVGPNPSGAWEGKQDSLATFSAGDWLFTEPTPGMRCYHKGAATYAAYLTSWELRPAPALAAGGATIDSEARLAIENLINALRAVGVFAD